MITSNALLETPGEADYSSVNESKYILCSWACVDIK